MVKNPCESWRRGAAQPDIACELAAHVPLEMGAGGYGHRRAFEAELGERGGNRGGERHRVEGACRENGDIGATRRLADLIVDDVGMVGEICAEDDGMGD